MFLAGAILAGGRARRLGGAHKPLLEVGGRRILDRARDALLPLVEELFVVGDAAVYAGCGLRVVPDLRPGLGPLAGLEAALLATAAEAVLLVGGDMPFLDEAPLAALCAAPPESPIACAASARGLEPLCARYARRILPVVRARLDGGALAMHALLEEVGAVAVGCGAEGRGLDNVNTPGELAAARARSPTAREV